jgi:uncharacterized RDD family membrane protein YckC
MASLHIEKTTWDSALGSLGWQGPIGDSLWAHFGGGTSQDLTWELVYRTIMSVGWTQDHAEVLWKAVAAHMVPVPPEPTTIQPEEPAAINPVEQIVQVAAQTEVQQAPWERQVMEDPLAEPEKQEKPKKSKGKSAKAAKPAKPAKEKSKKEFNAPDLGLAPKRLIAALVDGFIVVALGFVSSMALGLKPADMVGKSVAGADITKVLMAGVLMSLLAGAYFVFTMKRPDYLGQSLGKQIMGIKVVRQDTDPVDPRTIIMRQVVGAVLLPWLVLWQVNNYLSPVGYLALVVFLLLSLRGRGVTDLVASTEVIEA